MLVPVTLRRHAIYGSTLGLAGCAGGSLDPKGPVAAAQFTIMMDALVIMLAIVLPTIAAAVAFAWWFRETNPRAVYRPGFVYSGRIEIVVWSVPTLIIIFLGGIIWIGSHDLDPWQPVAGEGPQLEVQVVALPWKWLFILPDQGVASVGELVVPTGAPVHLMLTDSSVLNTFWVPQLAGMIYTMNGMTTQLNLRADHPGTFAGRSGMFSGDGFPAMKFALRAVSRDAFGQWVDRAKSQGEALDRAAYAALTRPGTVPAPYTYRTVEPGLFAAVASQEIPPAAGPANGPNAAAQRAAAAVAQ